MSIVVSEELNKSEFADQVHQCDAFLDKLLPSIARAYWDLRTDERGRPLLVLGLSDPFGYASADFAPDEIQSSDNLHRRIDQLVSELIQSARRQRIEIRDAFVTPQQIEDFRNRLNSIPEIAKKGVKLYNRLQMAPSTSDRMLLTEFAVEVDADIAEQVKQVVRDSGFNLQGEPILNRHGIKQRVRDLVALHLKDDQPTPRYAICFNVDDAIDIHLLEISDDAPDVPEADIEGIGLAAGDAVPGARSIVLYLVTPAGLRRAWRQQPQHPLFRDLRGQRCWFVYPDDGGIAFYHEFSDLPGE